MQEQNFSEINNRVNTIHCFLCGREFGTKGFSFHHKQCRMKFTNEQKLRPPKDRIKAPAAPEGISDVLEGKLDKVDLKKFNMKSNQIHKYKVLPACKYCGRTFNYESLAPHMKGCDKQKSYKEQKENASQPNYKAPKTLVCCVCGQRFGTFSLKIHYPQCTKKFNDDEFRKHKKESDRRKPPQFSKEEEQLIKSKVEWNDEEIETFNQRATENYRAKGMVECYNCKRKFFDQQLPKHQKNCMLINGSLNAPEKVQKKQIEIKKPRMVTCVICGRQYGLVSISIHNQNCAELFTKQQSLKLKAERKVLPEIPAELKEEYNLKQAESWSMQKLQAYNKLVSNIYNTKSLTKCYICNRTFFEESLPKHMKECETKIKDMRKLQKFKKEIRSKSNSFGQNFLQNVIQMNKQLNRLPQKPTSKPKMLMCYLCGREYGVASLKIHVPQCKAKPTHSKKLENESFQKTCDEIELKYKISEAESWTSEQIQVYNKQVYEIYKKESLFECKYCHRTFFQQSLKKHIKHCEKNASKEEEKKSRLKRAVTLPLNIKAQDFLNENDISMSEQQFLNQQTTLNFITEVEQSITNQSQLTSSHITEQQSLIVEQKDQETELQNTNQQ